MFSKLMVGALLTRLLMCAFVTFPPCHGLSQQSMPWSPQQQAVQSLDTTTAGWIAQQEATSLQVILSQFSPPGAVKGFMAASLSTSHPDYFYTWTRDSALVARVVVEEYDTHAVPETLTLLKDYVAFQIHAQQTSTVCNCLGEPKFNPNGAGFDGSWGRPQNDGPAERAITFLLFANRLVQHHSDNETKAYVKQTLLPAVYKDLDYVQTTWSAPCFDLWEEVKGVHFYTLMVMRQALLDGHTVALDQGDAARAQGYQDTAKAITERLETFWTADGNIIRVTQDKVQGIIKPSGLDVSTLLAANLAARLNDEFFSPGSDKILATAAALEDRFASLFSLNQDAPAHLGTAIGRYPEDVYDGYGVSLGNPWFLATTAYAELYYHAMREWRARQAVAINEVNHAFFAKLLPDVSVGQTVHDGTPDFDTLLKATARAANRFLNTVYLHRRDNGSLSEQFNRDTGFEQGARDLTWSHAAFITAVRARADVLAA